MRPRQPPSDRPDDLFRARLEQIIDLNHELVRPQPLAQTARRQLGRTPGRGAGCRRYRTPGGRRTGSRGPRVRLYRVRVLLLRPQQRAADRFRGPPRHRRHSRLRLRRTRAVLCLKDRTAGDVPWVTYLAWPMPRRHSRCRGPNRAIGRIPQPRRCRESTYAAPPAATVPRTCGRCGRCRRVAVSVHCRIHDPLAKLPRGQAEGGRGRWRRQVTSSRFEFFTFRTSICGQRPPGMPIRFWEH